MIATPPARPRSITALAVLLFAVTLGGIVLTILFGGFFEIGVPRYLVVCVGVGYSMSAFASAVGLWRMAAWSVKVFGLWCVFAVALCMLMTASAGSPWSQVLVIALAALLGVAALAVYVSRQLGRSDPKAS